MSDPTMVERDPHSMYQHAEQVKQRYQAELLSKANVIGVGVGLKSREGLTTDEVAIIVMVSKKKPKAEIPDGDLIPTEIEGIPVDVQEVGRIGLHD